MRSSGIFLALVAASTLTACPNDTGAVAPSPDPPSAPTNLRSQGSTCVPPKCPEISSEITLTWDAPTTGDTVIGYDIFHGTLKAGSVEADLPTFVERDVTVGSKTAYQVVARSAAGDSPRSASLTVQAPDPPASAAQLTGVYRATVSVNSVQYLDVLEGIEGAKVGDTRTFRWGFEAACPANTGPCPTKVFTFTPALPPKGQGYAGTVNSPDAVCGTTEVPVTYTYHLATDGGVGSSGTWRVKNFEGTYTIAFTCQSVTSTGTLAVTGTAVG